MACPPHCLPTPQNSFPPYSAVLFFLPAMPDIPLFVFHLRSFSNPPLLSLFNVTTPPSSGAAHAPYDRFRSCRMPCTNSFYLYRQIILLFHQKGMKSYLKWNEIFFHTQYALHILHRSYPRLHRRFSQYCVHNLSVQFEHFSASFETSQNRSGNSITQSSQTIQTANAVSTRLIP